MDAIEWWSRLLWELDLDELLLERCPPPSLGAQLAQPTTKIAIADATTAAELALRDVGSFQIASTIDDQSAGQRPLAESIDSGDPALTNLVVRTHSETLYQSGAVFSFSARGCH